MAYRPKDTRERLLHRLKIAKGHLNKVIKMVEEDAYCINVIHQSQAIQRALSEVDSLTFENHLKGCVVDHIKNGETDETVREVMKVFRKSH